MRADREHVKILRDQRGWSQQHLADASGLSLRTIQRIESKGNCSKESLLSVAAAFDVEIVNIGRPDRITTSFSNTVSRLFEMMKRYMNWFGGIYIVLLAMVILVSYFRFGTLYQASRPMDYDEFNSVYVDYRNFLALSGIGLAIYLGTWASGYGYAQNALWKGGLAFTCGVAITGAAFSILPWLLHPYDQYSAGAVFVFSGLIPGIFCFSCVSLLLYGVKRTQFLLGQS